MNDWAKFHNVAPFCCPICKNHCAVGAGIVLPKCLHNFCMECINRFDFGKHLELRCPNFKISNCEATVSTMEMAAINIITQHEPFNHPKASKITAEDIEEKNNVNTGSLAILENDIMKVENMKTILEDQVELDAVVSENHEVEIITTVQDKPDGVCDIPIEGKSNEESPTTEDTIPGDSNIKRHSTSEHDEEDGNNSAVCPNTENNLQEITTNSTDNTLESYKVDIFPNTEELLCPICLKLCPPGDGMLLQNCGDPVCKMCMKNEILTSDYSSIKCPYYNCFGILNHCEIRCLLSTDEFEMFIQRSVRSYTDEPSTELANLMYLDDIPAIRNSQPFDCTICYVPCPPGDGIFLRNCQHEVCAACLLNWVNSISELNILCPFENCTEIIEEREVAALMTDVQYEQFRMKNLRLCEQMLPGTYHCRTKDCPGFCLTEDYASIFVCSVCNVANCIVCQVIHKELSCEQFASVREGRDEDSSVRAIRAEIEKRLTMQCPVCKVPIQKISGCAHLHCLMCKTSFNWAY